MVTGAPAGTLLVGDSVRLAATALNATGGVVSDQSVTWNSTDPTVAAVSSSGLVVALGAGTATITAASNGHAGSTTVDVRSGGPIGTQGGILSAIGGVFSLTVPVGGVQQATLLLVRPALGAPQDARLVGNSSYELGPDGVTFVRPATLSIKYDPAKLASGTVEQSLQLYTVSAGAWTVVRGSTVNTTTKAVAGAIGSSGIYAVRSMPVDQITLTGAVVGGALYAGQTAQIGVGLYAATGDSLVARPIAWTSSDRGKVTVDSAGKVTAVSAGTATLTATTDGKTASATVTVLTRPTADWSAAAEWTTYQGNAQHSGYVNATLDPGVFRERWVSTVAGGTLLNQPSAGDGRVYVSTSGYFTSQRLFALSPADGSQQWVRDFGAIFGINQPTYDNGSVYMTSGGHEDTFMYALNAGDGSLRFKTAFDSQWEHWRAPVVSGQTVLTAGGYYGGMYGFDVTSGQRNFFMALSQVSGWAPAAANGVAYAFNGVVGSATLNAVTPADGSVQYQVNDSRLPAAGTPVIGGTNDAFVIVGNRLVSVDLVAKRVAWEQSGGFIGIPSVASGVVYAASNTQIAARRESDGAALWTWGAPPATTMTGAVIVTNNLLFVGVSGGYGSPGTTYAVDLATHLPVWSYPGVGEMALSSQGVLYIAEAGGTLAAIAVR